MVALVATSCKKKEEETSFNINVGETYGFEVGPSLDGSKAYFDPNDGYRFKWNQGDRVLIYNLADDYQQSEVGEFMATQNGASSAFTPITNVGSPKNIGYRVFYNAGNAEQTIEAGNRVTFHVPTTQTYKPEYLADNNAMVMACTAIEYQGHVGIFNMEHIFGYLNVAIYNKTGENSKQVSSIEVTDAQWNLTGDLELQISEVEASDFTALMNLCESTNAGPAYLTALTNLVNKIGYNATPVGKTVTMNCNNFNLPNNQYQYFLISLRPGALYQGFTVKINYSDNTYSKKTYPASMDYLIKPAYFRNVYAVTDGRWYVNGQWEQQDPQN